MVHENILVQRWMNTNTWRWALGLTYILAVAAIWIASSYIVQSVVDGGVSPFLITYICNSLFVIYIPVVEIARYLEDSNVWSWCKSKLKKALWQAEDLEKVNLLQQSDRNTDPNALMIYDRDSTVSEIDCLSEVPVSAEVYSVTQAGITMMSEDSNKQVDAKGRWTRTRVAKVSLLICPFWFLAQLTFNLSLKYITVTSNTILSSSSSLFTFLVSVAFLGETFTCLKLTSVILCMGGTVIVSLADSDTTVNAIASNALLGDILALGSAGIYSIYITLIRKKLPDENKGEGEVSTAQFLGFLGLFNLLIFLPIALILNFTNLEPLHKLSWKQFGLVVGKGLLDNVFSDYLWAKAILLTTTTVATAGLTIQVPIAALVDSLTGHAPRLMDYVGAAAVMVGFAGINIPSDAFSRAEVAQQAQEAETVVVTENQHELHVDRGSPSTSCMSNSENGL